MTKPRNEDQAESNIARRWGVTEGARVWVGGHDTEAKREIEKHLIGTARPPTGPIDAAFVAPLSTDEAIHFAGKLRDRLTPDGRLWIMQRAGRVIGDAVEATDSRSDAMAGASSASTWTYSALAEFLADLSFVPMETIHVSAAFLATGYRRISS